MLPLLRSPLRLCSLAVVCAAFALVSCGKKEATPKTTVPSKPAVKATDLTYEPSAIGAPLETFGNPIVTNLQVVDLDKDGLLDVLYCEARLNTVRWIRQAPRGTFTETVIGTDLLGPAHVWAADVNGSGKLDVLVACMGQINPNNDPIGSIVILENKNNRTFVPHVILSHVSRVSDVRAADLVEHKNGLQDLVVTQFGYTQGETRWMRNLGDWHFESEIVNTQSGGEFVPVDDYDGDGKPDFAALISQEWEEVHLFLNQGGGHFKPSIVWGSTNEDYGSSGLINADINGDGKPDLVYTNGDAFDYAGFGTRPWHGVQWLENKGKGEFAFHRIGDLMGAYGPCAADLNGDGTIDILAVSCFADWSDPKSISMMAWLNDGHEHFTAVPLATAPTHLVTAAVADLDGDGVPEIVTGGFHTYAPYEKMSNITLWRRK